MQRKSYEACNLRNVYPTTSFKSCVMQGVGRPLRDMALSIRAPPWGR